MQKLQFKRVFLIAAVGNLLALTGDTTFTWSSPILPKLESNDTSINPLHRPISELEESWVSSILNIGCICGMVPFALIATKIGRKYTLVLIAVPHAIAYLTLAFAHRIEWYYFARFLNGVSLSSGYMILTMYLAEISEDSYRGMLMLSYSTFAALGDLLCYIAGPYLDPLWFNLLLASIPIIFLVAFSLLAVESPYFLIQKNKKEEARNVLERLRSGDCKNIEKDLEEISNEIHQEDKGNFVETLKSRQVIKAFILSVGLFVGQQFSGVTAILAFTQLIFESAGSTLSSEVSSIIVGLAMFVGSCGGPLIVDRKGRRFLLFMSTSGIIISETLLGTYLYCKDLDYDVTAFNWLPILSLIVFILSYNIGMGPIPNSITSEILPNNVKFLVASASNMIGWFLGFITSMYFLQLSNALGRGQVFWLFSGCTIGTLIFVLVLLPETKGKSLQEIQTILSK